jgi:hypothetical protein
MTDSDDGQNNNISDGFEYCGEHKCFENRLTPMVPLTPYRGCALLLARGNSRPSWTGSAGVLPSLSVPLIYVTLRQRAFKPRTHFGDNLIFSGLPRIRTLAGIHTFNKKKRVRFSPVTDRLVTDTVQYDVTGSERVSV